MSKSHALLRIFRLAHLYIGVFIAPALLFFAFTGALQTFSLHETTPGSSYKPPAWAMTLAQIHKKQTAVIPQKKLAPGGEHAPGQRVPDVKTGTGHDDGGHAHASDHAEAHVDGPPAGGAPAAPKHNPLPLKIFFLLVSVGLFTSTLTGIYMAFKYSRRPMVILGLLVAGIVVPVAMLLV